MSRYKSLPKISKNEYEVSEELSLRKYKLTKESRIFRDKIVDFVNKNMTNNPKLASVYYS